MDAGTIVAAATVLVGLLALHLLNRILGWAWYALAGTVLAALGVACIASGELASAVLCIAAAVALMAWCSGVRPAMVPPSYWWQRRPGSHVVYILRNAEGVPLYIGRTEDFTDRIAQHRRKPHPWRKTIDSFNSMPVRWVRGKQAAIRIERRRIRCATVLTSWRYVPELYNEAEVTSGRVWFPRVWAVLYAAESLIFWRARLLSPLRMGRPFVEAEQEPEPIEHHVSHEGAESFDDRWPDRVILLAQVRSGGGASASTRPPQDVAEPDPPGRAADHRDADADADVPPPSGESRRFADESAGSRAEPSGDLDAILRVVNGDSSPAQDQTAPMDTPAVVVKLSAPGSRGRSKRSGATSKGRGNPKHDEATRERWRRNKAAARAEGRAR